MIDKQKCFADFALVVLIFLFVGSAFVAGEHVSAVQDPDRDGLESRLEIELGMNPKRFGKIANHKQQPWKAPLPVFIEGLYFKRFGKTRPDQVKTIEQLFKAEEKKKAERRARKKLKKQTASANTGEGVLPAD